MASKHTCVYMCVVDAWRLNLQCYYRSSHNLNRESSSHDIDLLVSLSAEICCFLPDMRAHALSHGAQRCLWLESWGRSTTESSRSRTRAWRICPKASRDSSISPGTCRGRSRTSVVGGAWLGHVEWWKTWLSGCSWSSKCRCSCFAGWVWSFRWAVTIITLHDGSYKYSVQVSVCTLQNTT